MSRLAAGCASGPPTASSTSAEVQKPIGTSVINGCRACPSHAPRSRSRRVGSSTSAATSGFSARTSGSTAVDCSKRSVSLTWGGADDVDGEDMVLLSAGTALVPRHDAAHACPPLPRWTAEDA
jgi:hypothetical protein